MEPLALQNLHEKTGARFLELSGRCAVADHGDAVAEWRAAREAAALHDASYREALRLTGSERASFLHGMVTQDIQGLPPGRAAYAAMLTAKGAMVADVRVVPREADLVLDLEPGTGARVREFLERYLISEDAEIHEATGEVALLRLLGPRTDAVLSAALGGAQAPLAPLALRPVRLEDEPVLLIGAGVPGVPGVDLLVPRAALEPVWRALAAAGEPLGLRALGFSALEWLRVEAGVPRYGQDLVESTIPLEANLAHAISYNKGCYIGQEVIARATFRGHVNRRLVGLLLGEGEAAPGAELRSGERKVGWLTSVVRSPALGQTVALGYVHRDFLEPGTALSLAGTGAPATVHALPLVPPAAS